MTRCPRNNFTLLATLQRPQPGSCSCHEFAPVTRATPNHKLEPRPPRTAAPPNGTGTLWAFMAALWGFWIQSKMPRNVGYYFLVVIS